MPNEIHEDVKAHRHADHEIDPMFLNRWSPRAFASEPIDPEVLARVFEAARWAPSCFNEQPWRFVVATSQEDRARFVEILVPANQAWAKFAPVLMCVTSKKTFSHNGNPNPTHNFDAGCAWGFLAVCAYQNGLITHGMAGFDRDKARVDLNIPEDYDVLAMIALGKHNDGAQLPPEILAKEVPSNRHSQEHSVIHGKFAP
jgi:nitroreductase